MVTLAETTLELGLRPAARACRTTAGRPQGGTGVPAASNGLQQTRTAGTQNELTFVSGLLAPGYGANWNTTAVVGYDATTATWNVVQRYVYSPYGNIIILNPNFTTAPTGTVPMVNNLYQGMALDPVTGFYYERARWYSASLGTWISQDPLQYINGANTYQFVGSDPVGRVDPGGTCPALVARRPHLG